MIVKSEIMPRAGWQRSAQESAADGQRHRFRGSSTRVSDLELGWEHDDSSPRPRRHTFRPVLAMTVVLFAVVAVGGVVGGKAIKSALAPPDYEGRGSGQALVRIKPGATARDVALTMKRSGVVASADAFTDAVADRSTKLRPGLYRLRQKMSASQAVRLLFDPASKVQAKVLIPEGLRLDETLARLAKGSGIPLRDFERVAARPVGLGLPAYAHGKLEGFLFPATYWIEPGQSAQSVLTSMVTKFRQEADRVGLGGRADVVTVASLAQAEGGHDADFPKITRVIYNRLRDHQRLQLDSTVQYAQRRHSVNVSQRDTETDSPYNTYAIAGLPPGPIDAPGEAALRAALHPAAGDWHWFVTTDPMKKITKFTNQLSEFMAFRSELNANLKQRR